MKSLSQTLILVAVLFVGYLYLIHDTTDGDALIADLEARAGAIDVQERRIAQLKDDIYEEIKRYNADNKAEVDSLSKALEKLNKDLAYNQKARRLNSTMTAEEAIVFDSTKIIPFQRQIARIEERLEKLSPPDVETLKTQINEELNTLASLQESLEQAIINYSTYFYKAPDAGGRVVVENGLDAYGRPVKNEGQGHELSDMLFGKSTPTEEQKETFRQFHIFWCDTKSDDSPDICNFPWL